jgi:UDP-N-acetylenolpyruvoylglucosamine reductase
MTAPEANIRTASAARETKSTSAKLETLVSDRTVIHRDEPMARRTTLRIGGPADFYVEPADEQDLAIVLQYCSERRTPIFILGRGSNVLIKDRGFRGMVICLAQPHFSRIEIQGERLRCGAGAKLKQVAVEARRHDLTDLEFLEGIPGTIGGALRMNAGAMGGATFDVVESVRMMDLNAKVVETLRADLPVEYRSCSTLKTHIALSAVLRGHTAAREAIEARMNQFSQKRWSSQPAAPSAGCMFKNPASIPAGQLIDELGLKGTRVGGALISLEHGNFLVNAGDATAADVLALMELARNKARQERAIELRTEVEIVGE